MPGLTFFFFVLEYTTNRRATPDYQVVSCQLSVVSPRPNTSKTRRTSQIGVQWATFRACSPPRCTPFRRFLDRDTRCKGEKFPP